MRAETLAVSLYIIVIFYHVVSNETQIFIARVRMSEILGGPAAKTNTWICQADSAVNHPRRSSIRPQRARREANYSRIAINKARNSGIVPPAR